MSVQPNRPANRLLEQPSPYLKQHAYNPVDWYPWGEEAFEKAVQSDKPVFLSIGYSTCHWCHVMERESFDDPEVAAFLNKHFIAVKVDREERPDVDHTYMAVCQWMTGQGGWPMTVVMTPDKKPFFAGTYFPKVSKHGKPGLLDVLRHLFAKWREDRGRVAETAEQIVADVQQRTALRPDEELDLAILDTAYEAFAQRYDPQHGGFGSAPKFPTAHQLLYLMRDYVRGGREQSLEMVEHTLQMMARGGLFDQIGGGFARYSTDARWLVPHFEKMLYDNALLLMAYTEAYQLTGKAFYRDIVERTVDYAERDLRGAEGLWFAAEDADSGGGEGTFYLWTPEEIVALFGEDIGAVVCAQYGVNEAGNFEGKSILHLLLRDEQQLAEAIGMDPAKWAVQLRAIREAMLEARFARVRPHRDEKVLTGWNALWIAALAKASAGCSQSEWLDQAKTGWSAMKQLLRRADGRWLVRYCEGRADVPAFADDYAYLLWAAIELYHADGSVVFLDDALQLAEEMKRLFWDDTAGIFRFSGADNEPMVLHLAEHYDGALPSANGVAAWQLQRLGRLLHEADWEETGQRIARAFAGPVMNVPAGHAMFLIALDWEIGLPQELVVSGWDGEAQFGQWWERIGRMYLPFCTLIRAPEQARALIDRKLPGAKGKIPMHDQPTAYLCEDGICMAPYTEWAALERRLKAVL